MTLYININGENIQSTDKITVVETKDAIINKFYFELGKGIIGDVMARGIANVKRIGIVKDFADHEGFDEILDQWERVKMILLGKVPKGTMKITLPKEYITWLNNNGAEAYGEIAKSLYDRGCVVEISIDNIYTNIGSVLNLINDKNDYGEFVVNDNAVTDESAISVEIRKRIGENVPFVSFEEWEERMTKDSENNGKPKDQSGEASKDSENPGRYDEIQSFHEGMAVVRKGDKYGFIGLNGEEVVPCKYKKASRFSDGVALVDDKTFINHNGNIELKVLDDNLSIMGDFHDGFCRVRNNTNNLYGYVDKTGFLFIDCKYQNARDFKCEHAIVWKEGKHKRFKDCHSLLAYIDTSGNENVSYTSDGYTYEASNFIETYIPINRKSSFVAYGYAEQFVIKDDNIYAKAVRLSAYGYQLVTYNSKGSDIHLDDNSLANNVLFFKDSETHQWVWYDIRLLYKSYKSDSCHYKSSSFVKTQDSRKYSAWGWFSEEGLQPFKNNYSKLWGYISTKNEVVVDFLYEDVRIHSEGLAAVSKDGRWGYIDAKGKVAIPFSYSKATEFSEGRAVVEKDGVIMVINNEGNRIV